MNISKILVIDASSAGAFAQAMVGCVVKEDAYYRIVSCERESGKRAAENVCVVMRRALQKAGWDKDSPPQLIGVIIGPGSFTGLRASCAAAQGYGFALGIKTLGLLKSDVLKRALNEQILNLEQQGKKLDQWGVFSQARKGHVFIETEDGVQQFSMKDDTFDHQKNWLLAGELRREFAQFGFVSDIEYPTPQQIAQAAYESVCTPSTARSPFPYYVEPPRVSLSKK